MATSGQTAGQNGFVTVEVSSVAKNVSGDANSSSLGQSAEAPENTGYQSGTRTRLAGLKDWTFEFSGFFNDTSGTGVTSVLDAILATQTLVTWGPAGSASGFVKYTGCGVVTDYSAESPVDGVVTASFTIVASAGSLTKGTF